MPVPRWKWDTISTELYPSPSLVQPQHTLQASIHVSSYTQVCRMILPWLRTKILGSVKITISFTRRKNALLDRLGNKRIIFPVASRGCRNWYRWQAEWSMPAQRHAVMVSSTWSPSVCSAQDQQHEAQGSPTQISHGFTKTGSKLTEPYL